MGSICNLDRKEEKQAGQKQESMHYNASFAGNNLQQNTEITEKGTTSDQIKQEKSEQKYEQIVITSNDNQTQHQNNSKSLHQENYKQTSKQQQQQLETTTTTTTASNDQHSNAQKSQDDIYLKLFHQGVSTPKQSQEQSQQNQNQIFVQALTTPVLSQKQQQEEDNLQKKQQQQIQFAQEQQNLTLGQKKVIYKQQQSMHTSTQASIKPNQILIRQSTGNQFIYNQSQQQQQQQQPQYFPAQPSPQGYKSVGGPNQFQLFQQSLNNVQQPLQNQPQQFYYTQQQFQQQQK